MKKDIKIVAVISSPNFNGNTASLVREAINGAKEEGASVTEIFLANYKLEFCKGCLICNAKGKCPINDGFEEIRKLIYEADGIILGSPTYALEYNAVMKCFFERLGTYTLYTSLLGGKYAVGISTSYKRNGAKNVAKKLTSIFKFGIFERSYISGTLGVHTMVNGAQKKVCESNDDLKKANELGRKITKDIKSNNRYTLQTVIMRAVIALYLKPIFKNKEQKERASYYSLHQRGLI
ncbi:flavodoxin family protein [Clostridium beijerinckii]|uniref:2-amino-4-deoxychorismate dehydrogenase n=1 Tax=Clostridium beijerinckii TaxID=1520 RepID=A0A1S8S4G2_CLOBE|nr:flavodoxin family protein [Clostridium beijerinckii]NRY59518.1 multimeric flavodoxin WrbA [Clostridium beijerinckii]OOM60274.1 2-amino-4-deoxychorismate dehydrogenase [Clostridium beijerinckii]